MQRIKFPDKLQCLFQPMRYKVLHGGRGGAKSWGIARARLLLGAEQKKLTLCTREVQKSIRDSVYKLLADQIAGMGLQSFYEIQSQRIIGRNGSEFIFSGLSDMTADSIKSFEGVDCVWIEEGQSITKRSLDILIPTIRKDGSEIWISFNPSLETDEIYQRFVVDPPEDAFVIEINYRDNPWFPATLEKERIYCQKHDPDNYDNIWEGKCKPAVEGAIYYREIQAAQIEGRICRVPYDPMLLVHVVFDLGYADNMAIAMVQRQASEVRIIDYIEGHQQTLADYSAQLRERRYNWGTLFLPHDGFSKGMKTGRSCAEIFTELGWQCAQREEIAVLDVENGIKQARLVFPRTVFDARKCAPLIEHLKRYRRAVNKITKAEGAPLHDEHSDAADCYRYVAVNVRNMTNTAAADYHYTMPESDWRAN